MADIQTIDTSKTSEAQITNINDIPLCAKTSVTIDGVCFTKPNKKTAEVWDYFLISLDGQKAYCRVLDNKSKVCGKLLRVSNSSTTSIRGHAIDLHKIKFSDKEGINFLN